MPKSFCLEVSGEFACFTRPEMKAERVSYEVITPSAARAIFEAILWKPAISWSITKIEVLNPISWINIKRNEVAKKFAMPRNAIMQGGEFNTLGFFIEDDRQQRSGLLLRDVKYRLHANLIFHQEKDPKAHYSKYCQMFKRRAENGQCFNQPYLGTREFSCAFKLINDPENQSPCIKQSKDLGWMFYDMDYSNLGSLVPGFFQANMTEGVIEIPSWDSEAVKR